MNAQVNRHGKPLPPYIIEQNKRSKMLKTFWRRVDRCSRADRLTMLKGLAEVRFPLFSHSNAKKREAFNDRKPTGYYRSATIAPCIVCGGKTECRHHLIQIQHGGDNSRWNVVGLCEACHAEVHPWLKTG